jgi:hypothetical protein
VANLHSGQVGEEALISDIHCSTAQIEPAIRNYIAAVNAIPKPFQFTKSTDILAGS